MFICEITKKSSKLCEPMNKVIAQTREKIYTKWVKDEDTGYWQEVECGKGFEIIRELRLSAEGLALWQSWSDEDKRLFLKQR